MKKHIVLKKGDIADSVVDAIVNAANTYLKLGGGVSGAINRKGGPSIQKEMFALLRHYEDERVPQGEAVVTRAGNLKATFVIHAAVLGGKTLDAEILRNCILNSLKRADEHKLQSIALPAIGTGAGGFPLDRCAQIMVDIVYEYLQGDTTLLGAMFVLYKEPDLKVFEEEIIRKGVEYRCV